MRTSRASSVANRVLGKRMNIFVLEINTSMKKRRAPFCFCRQKATPAVNPLPAQLVLFLLEAQVFQEGCHSILRPPIPGGPRFRTQRFVPGQRGKERERTPSKGLLLRWLLGSLRRGLGWHLGCKSGRDAKAESGQPMKISLCLIRLYTPTCAF